MNERANGGGTTPPQQPKMQVLGQFIRDLSFENVLVRNGLTGAEIQPDIGLQVSLDGRARQIANQYEVSTKLKATSANKSDKATLFILEIDYVGVFQIDGVPEEQMHPFLMIECPRMLFPFLRRIVADVTRDGGFPPLNIDQIDFLQLYRQEAERRAAQAPDPQKVS